ncbi:MAG: ceramidase domain-containing protein [Maritimibacter sp.]
MEWMAQVDNYCERLDMRFWAEPLNAVTNAAFLIAALVLLDWTRSMAAGRMMARALSWILLVLAFGSFAFHTFATTWAMLADVAPIIAFVLLYIFALSHDVMGQNRVKSALIVLGFLGFTALMGPLFARLDFVGSSAAYLPIPLFLAGLLAWISRHHPQTAQRLGAALALMVLSLTLRTVDMPLCATWPHGTHFLWHLINGLMLGWFIETYRRHMLAGEALQR